MTYELATLNPGWVFVMIAATWLIVTLIES